LDRDIAIDRLDLFNVMPPAETGMIVMNPPYAVRLGSTADLEEFYPRLGRWMKQRCVGWQVHIFTADLNAPKKIGLSPSRRIPLYNGALECRLYTFPIVQGGMRRRPPSMSPDPASPQT
jgi:putative N6-adenine-specific DNA methylase